MFSKDKILLLGNGVALNDCDDNKLALFESPPSGVWTLKGSYPMVSFWPLKYLKLLTMTKSILGVMYVKWSLQIPTEKYEKDIFL